MALDDKLKEIDRLQEKINSYGAFPEEVKKKINYKFRLDWNYYSNSMEGGTLTKEETRSVMIGNIDIHNKPIKDVFEMRGHDEVVNNILRIGKGEQRLSEKRIKEIHKLIIHEEDPEKKKLIGEWKTKSNEIINYRGEKFEFVSPHEVKERMHQLLDKTNAAIDAIYRSDKKCLHPVMVALQFHLEYVSIHPFYDGNGRTARVLTNLILISFGYPPFIVKEAEKDRYNQLLADIQGYGGNPDLFYELLTDLVIRSQEIVLDALEGKNIDEADDVDKELELFKRSLDKSKERKEIRNPQNVQLIISECGIQLISLFIKKMSAFNDLFHHNENRIIFTYFDQSYNLIDRSGGKMLDTTHFPEATNQWLNSSTSYFGRIETFGIEYFLKGYKMGHPFDLNLLLSLNFSEYNYHVSFRSSARHASSFEDYNYDDLLSYSEMTGIVNSTVKDALKFIKANTPVAD